MVFGLPLANGAGLRLNSSLPPPTVYYDPEPSQHVTLNNRFRPPPPPPPLLPQQMFQCPPLSQYRLGPILPGTSEGQMKAPPMHMGLGHGGQQGGPPGSMMPGGILPQVSQPQQQQQQQPPHHGAPGTSGAIGPSGAIGSAAVATSKAITSSAAPSNTISRPTASTVGGRPSIANTTNIDTLLNARQKPGGMMENMSDPTEPSDKIQDKVAFIFNNLSIMNMDVKAKDLKDALCDERDDYTAWLAQYLVMKRASIEPNFHNLYSSFLETLKNPKLYEAVLKETFSNIQILLGKQLLFLCILKS